jgi:hypothetical protein
MKFSLLCLSAALVAVFGAGQAAAQSQSQSAGTLAYAPPSAGAVAVGEVSFAVGPAVRISRDGVPEHVSRGSKVQAGDRLETAEGGLIHVRFVDGAMVSLRPGSRLWIEDYRYNPAQVSQSLVRFRLEQGVARAISGAAAEGAKERFRLNTPLVAIGVRGTDFVVRSDADATTASVNQGAIVMAPFGAGCVAQALGPCTSPSAKLLSADMGQLLVEFRPQFSQPEIKPQQAQMLASARSADGARGEASVAAATAPTRPAQHAEEEAVAANLVRGLVVGTNATPVPPLTPMDPATVPPVVAAAPAQLMWGRWADGAALAADISVARDTARLGRVATVGNDQYLLYRTETGAGDVVPGLGAYQFTLQQGQAQYSVPGQAVSAATVQGGQLGIDFANRRFTTSLSVGSAATGTVGIAGSGFVGTNGVFFDRSVAGTAIAGATALDGKSAGYLFEKAVGAGTLSGITLWSRP